MALTLKDLNKLTPDIPIARVSASTVIAKPQTVKAPQGPVNNGSLSLADLSSLTPDIPIKLQSQKENSFVDSTIDLGQSFGKGITSSVRGIGGAISALGFDKAGNAVTKFAKKVDEKYLKVKDESAFQNQLAAGLGSASTFFIPGIGIELGSARLAIAVPRVAAYLGLGSAAVLESSVNAGSVYNEAKARGFSDDDAQKAAGKTFALNLPTNIVLDRWMFNKLPEGKRLGGIIKAAGQEGFQEGIQQAIQNLAIHDPILSGTGTSALIGGATGGLIKGGIVGVDVLRNKPPQSQGQQEDQNMTGSNAKTNFGAQPSESVMPEVTVQPKATLTVSDLEDLVPDAPLDTPKEKPLFDPVLIGQIKVGIEQGKSGERLPIKDDQGYTTGYTGEASSFPGWFQNKGFKKKESLNAIEKYIAGQPLTEKQKTLVTSLYDSYKSGNDYLHSKHLESDLYDNINRKLVSNYDGQSISDFIEFSKVSPDLEVDNIDGIPITVKDIANAIEHSKSQGNFSKTIENAGVAETGVDSEIQPKESRSTSENLSFSKNPALSSKNWSVSMAMEPKTEEKVNKTSILRSVEKDFNIPIRGKVTERWQKLKQGEYKTKGELIRLRNWGELEVLSHELAHHIDYTERKIAGKNWLDKKAPDLKELQSLDYDPVAKRTHEGFAEFMRYYLTTDKAPEMAPKFHRYFQEEFLTNNPTLAKKIDSLKSRLTTWQEQGALNRTLAQIDFKGEHTKLPLMDKAKKAQTFVHEKFINELYPIEKVTKEVEKISGKNIRPSKNPFKLATYSKAKSLGIARTFVMDKAIDESANIVGPGLSEIISQVPNQDMNTFIAYASAKRAKDLAARGIESGFDAGDVDYVLSKYQNPTWDKAASDITQWSNHLVDWLVRAGGLTDESAQLMRDLNPVYLPFKRAFSDEMGVRKGSGGMVNTNSGIKSIKGSGRPIVNPIESLITQAADVVAKAQKLRVAKAIADLAEEEGVAGFITKVPAPADYTKVTPEQFSELLNKSGLIAKKDQANTKNLIQMMGEEGLMDMLSIFGTKSQYQGKDNIVMIWKNGKREFYELHPELYQALTGIDPIQLGPLLKIMSPFSRLLRLGATGLNVGFAMVRNPFRDFLGYSITSKKKNATPLDPIMGAYREFKSKEGDLAWRFKKGGGAMSGQMGYDRAAAQAVYDEILRKNLGKKGIVLEIAKNPLNTIRDFLGFWELAPRITELTGRYEELKKQNPDWTEEDVFIEAFNDAQDVTTNFTRSGAYGKKINEAAAFFNASIQGSSKAYRTFKDYPVKTVVRGLLYLTLPALMFWYLNKDEEWYRNLENAYKYTNFFIPIGDKTILRLPTPFDIGTVFISAPVAGIDALYRKKPGEIKDLLSVIKNMVPSIMPSLAQPLLDVATNKNFLDQPIETKGDQYKYPTERSRENTMELSKLLSKGFDKVGIRLSPIQIDYLINSYTGGFVRQFGTDGGRISNALVIGSMFLSMPEKPKRQMNEFFSEFEVLSQKKSSDILTSEERQRYNELVPINRAVRSKLKVIKRFQSEKKNDRVDSEYNKLRMMLENKGY